ncbi:MAG: hypothetical protein NZ853_09110 [Leptospiraceae bacterium]|nr:hypothetical protein [Leptospiraceae bacterium]
MKFWFCLVFIIAFSRVLHPQTPDLSPPVLFREILPGYKQEYYTPSQQDQSIEQEAKKMAEEEEMEISETQSESFWEKILSLFENRTFVNLIILAIIFTIFLVYRLRQT